MRTIILSAVLILSLAFGAMAANAEPVNEKVLKTFNQIFKGANDVSWSNSGNHYEAFFVVDNIQTRALLDTKGNLVQTIRYYKEENLPANVLYALAKDFNGKEVGGVTEVSNKNGVSYRIVLKDEKHYIHVNANSAGDLEVVKKYKRGDN